MFVSYIYVSKAASCFVYDKYCVANSKKNFKKKKKKKKIKKKKKKIHQKVIIGNTYVSIQISLNVSIHTVSIHVSLKLA